MNTERYQRQLVLPDFGPAGQQKLTEANVLIVGAGGLGVPVMQYLAGMGVGDMTLVDEDVVSLSNLQRQVIYRTEDVGKKKVKVAAQFIQKLNPEVQVTTVGEMLSRGNAKHLIEGKDVVIDCTDRIEARYLINDACVQLGVPFIYGALYRHEGHVGVFNYKGSVTYRDVYPDDSAEAENCNEIGVLGVLPGMIGCYQAMEAVKVLTGIGDILCGKLLIVDALNTQHHIFQLAKSPKTVQKPVIPEPDEKFLTWKELDTLDLQAYHLVDIRPTAVYETSGDPRFENIPMEQLAGFNPEKDKHVVLVCQRGVTTRQASMIVKSIAENAVIYQVKGGYNAR
ncbi:MAG: molybdopterin-synthase adenylyltransferase MoeB [Cyclobacteriaceae bacterium]